MSEQGTTKDQVSLGDLKRAIAAVPPLSPSVKTYVYQTARAEAWRVAFQWHVRLVERHAALSDRVDAHLTDWIAIDREEEEGIALVQEKLR